MKENFNPKYYFKYTKEEREYYLEQIMQHYMEQFISKDNEQTFYVSLTELLSYLEKQHYMAIKLEEYERAEIFKHLCKVYGKILENINREDYGM